MGMIASIALLAVSVKLSARSPSATTAIISGNHCVALLMSYHGRGNDLSTVIATTKAMKQPETNRRAEEPVLVTDWPFAYGATTLDNPWETLVPAYCKGPDILYADRVMHAGTPAWVPRRIGDLRRIYQATAHFSNAGMAPFAPLVGEHWHVLPLEADPPAHAAYRHVLNPAFTPKAIAQLDNKIRADARNYASILRDQGHCNFLEAVAFEFPIRVFLSLMAMPQSMAGEFLRWEHGLLHSSELDTLRSSTRAVVDYLTATIEERKQHPGDDLISYAVSTNKADGTPLSPVELLGVCFNLFIGGLDSVSTNMAWQFFHLATHPADQRRLRADPTMIPAAIDEMQRYYAAITTYRRCIEPFDVAGVTILPGEFVAMCTTFAGRDEREYGDPDVVRFERKPSHVAFGYGPHTCIGVHLARREMRIALEEFLAILPEFHLQTDVPMRTLLHNTLQPEILPLEWHPH